MAIVAITLIMGPARTAMTEMADLHRLLSWTSPAYPTGAFSYSQGLERAVEVAEVADEASLEAFAEATLARGPLWIDAVLFCAAWRAAADPQALDAVAELAAAWRASAEGALESRQQGRAFLSTARDASPHPQLTAFAARTQGRPVAHSTALAAACAAHGIALEPALNAYLHGAISNLVSAAIRLGVTGQSGGQRVIARLVERAPALAVKAMAADPDEIGTSAIALELFSVAHETQHTRLFRS